MKVCIFGTFDARHHPRVQVLEEGLVAHGFEVVRCNIPWKASTSERVAASRRPDVAARLLWRLLLAWFGLWRRSRRCRDVEVVVIGYLGVLDVHLARWCFPRARLVLDHLAPVGDTMEDRGRRGFVGRVAHAVDRAAVRRASLVIVDTEEHARMLASRRSVVVPVGAPSRWFDAPVEPPVGHDQPRPSPLSVVFFGLYTPLQGAPVIARALALALDRGARLKVDMVGHGQDLPQARRWLRDRSEVRWHRWIAPDDLPAFVARHDVCLGIVGTTPKAARVVPNKVFQGAAAGCAIVTSDTPPQRRAFGDAAIYVAPGDASALADVLVRLAADDAEVARTREAAADLARNLWHPEQATQPLVDRLKVMAS